MLKTALSLASGSGEKRGLLILTYHRTMACADPYTNDVTGEVFALHADILSSHCNVLRLDRAAEMLAEKSLPPRAVAVTFDDGYEDNFNVALPILQRYGIKATFFIATAYLDGGIMWNDIIIDAVKNASEEAVRGYLEAHGNDGIAVSSCTRVNLIKQQIQGLKYQDPASRYDAAVEFRDRLDVPAGKSPMMTRAQVRQLAQEGMEIGAHTVTHPILKQIEASSAEQEVVNSRRDLENITGTAVTSFAYPNGIPGRDFDSAHVDILKRHQFAAAVTTLSARADYSDDLLQLPRISLWHDHRGKFCVELMRRFLERSG